MSYAERMIRLIKCMYDNEEILINICCVNYIDRVKRKVRIHSDFGIYIYNGTIKYLQKRLPDYFVRTDRGNIININYVDIASVEEVVLKDGKHVHVSTTRRDRLNYHEVYGMNNENDNMIIAVKCGKDSVFINTDEIIYMERPYSELLIHTNNNIYLCRDTLKKYETKLSDGFCRIHKGYLINCKYIKYVTHNIVKMTSGEELPISRSKRQKLRKKL